VLLFQHQFGGCSLLAVGPLAQVSIEDRLFLISLEVDGLQEREDVIDSGDFHGLVYRLFPSFFIVH